MTKCSYWDLSHRLVTDWAAVMIGYLIVFFDRSVNVNTAYNQEYVLKDAYKYTYKHFGQRRLISKTLVHFGEQGQSNKKHGLNTMASHIRLLAICFPRQMLVISSRIKSILNL